MKSASKPTPGWADEPPFLIWNMRVLLVTSLQMLRKNQRAFKQPAPLFFEGAGGEARERLYYHQVPGSLCVSSRAG